MISVETFDVLVDGPSLNILPQRVPIRRGDTEQGGIEAVLEQILAALVADDGAAEPAAVSQIPSDRLALLVADAVDGLFSPVTSQTLATHVVPLARLRLVVASEDSVPADGDVSLPPKPQVVAQGSAGQEEPPVPILPEGLLGAVNPSVEADVAVAEVVDASTGPGDEGNDASGTVVAVIEVVEDAGSNTKSNADAVVAETGCGAPADADAEGGSPVIVVAVVNTEAAEADDNREGAAECCVEEPVLSFRDSVSVMLQVVRLAVADAVAAAPSEYSLSAQVLSDLRSAALSSALPILKESGSAGPAAVVDHEISVAFNGAILSGAALGASNRPRGPSAEVLALQSTIAQLLEQKSLLEARLAALVDGATADRAAAATVTTRTPPNEAAATDAEVVLSPVPEACPDPPLVPDDDDDGVADGGRGDSSAAQQQQQQQPVPLPTPSLNRQHTDAAAHMGNDDAAAAAEPPSSNGSASTSADAAADASASAAVAPNEAPCAETVDAQLNYTMVTCFYNHFDYVSKTTRKKGRALSLASSGSDTRYDVLRRAVKDTFRENLDIAFFDATGARQIINSDAQLTSVLLQAKPTGVRPIFQCFSTEQEAEEQERAEIGSSPKQIFTRTPTPPASAVAAVESPSNSRPASRPSSRQVSSAATNCRTPSLPTSSRPTSARLSSTTPATSLPFDYIAGNALTDEAIAQEFDVVARGGESVARDDVLLYLNARYDTIGHPNRFEQLYRSLFGRRKASINVHEFAIILLRLSQS